jgi:serine/threonine-protein kinase RsbW
MQSKENKEQCFCTLSSASELEKIRNFVSDCARKFGFDDKISYTIALAVDEACSNLIKYAFKMENNKEIQVKIKATINNFFEISISDEAEPFDPLQISSPNMTEYFKSFRKGGLGIHIMKLIMDDISYIPRSDKNKWNTLILKKQLS